MPDFKAKMHQNRFRTPLGIPHSTPPDPLAGFKGSTSKGIEGRARGEEGRGGSGSLSSLSPRFDNPGYGPVSRHNSQLRDTL